MFRSALFLLLLLFGTAGLSAKKGESLFDRWSHADQRAIDIYLNIDTLLANRNTTNEMRGTVVDGGLALGVDISVRGRYRRRTCSLPPMMLQFDKELLRLAGLNTHNDYKLVTPCTFDAAGQEAIVREALAYELYRTVNPAASFRTQLLTVTYHNMADSSSFTSYGIVIEDTDELKDRLDARNCKECFNQPLATYTNAETIALFQYMIGNADYSTRMARNLKLMQGEDGRITAVPYDFDFAGLVDPAYGVTVDPEQESLRDRVLVWEFDTPANLLAAGDEFLLLEDDLLAQVAGFEALQDDGKREVTRYLKAFFRELRHGRIGS